MTGAVAGPRPVRVTLEGTLQQITKKRSRLDYSGGSLILRHEAPDLVVEELPGLREWTDNDVVAGASGTVWCRVGGKWHAVAEHGVGTAYDASMAEVLDNGGTVLRYQAGDR